jgi:GNAT superfamily N-acetyltransferase
VSAPAIKVVSTPADVQTVARLLTRVFDPQPPNRWLVPDPELRFPAMEEFFGTLTEHAAAGAGLVHLTEDGHAAAVWFDRTTEASEPPGYAERIKAAAGPYADRFAELDEAFDAVHPADPHWHLAFVAVDEAYQSRGYGAAIMNHTHARLDERGIPVYLEATLPRNQAGYYRHGYVDLSPSQIVLGNPETNTSTHTGGATFYRMWREPVPGRATA